MSNYGIDVSSYNGIIDWKKVKAAGCGHAVLKITQKNLSADARFSANLKGVKANGIPYSVYRYVYESTEENAVTAAKAVVQLLKRYKAASDTVVWWDVEDKSIQSAAKTTLTPSIIAAQKVITDAGFGFGVYCGLYWYRSVLNTDGLNCPFWIARYPNTKDISFATPPAEKYRPAIKHALWGWQYSSAGKVPGINHATDLNMVYGVTGLYRTLRRGCKGDDVKELQLALNQNGADLKDDGIFGPVTEAAVKEYQLKNGLTPDGIVGPLTHAKLFG